MSGLPAWLEAYRAKRILAGFSAGADSTALLLLLSEAGYRVEAIHFEHGLRGEASREDAAHAAAFAGRLGVPFRLVELNLAPGPNLEERARHARLEAWRRLAGPDDVVALGHHAGDAAETLLMRLARGGNATSLTGLRPIRILRGVTFLRPLLAWSRAEIEAWLAGRGVTAWRTDATNADCRHLRNYLRNRLLPEWERAFPRTAAGIAASVRALSDDARFLEEQARELYAGCASAAALPASWFAGLPPALRLRVLRLWLEDNRLEILPGRRLLERMTNQNAGRLPLTRGIIIRCRGGNWEIEAGLPPDAVWRWREDAGIIWNGIRIVRDFPSALPTAIAPDTACFDADLLPPEVLITGRRTGDRIAVFGGGSPHPLKKLPPPRFILRTSDGTVLWAAGSRHSNHFPVTPATCRIARFRHEPVT